VGVEFVKYDKDVAPGFEVVGAMIFEKQFSGVGKGDGEVADWVFVVLGFAVTRALEEYHVKEGSCNILSVDCHGRS
jgi:hypothetical protein